MSRIRRVKCDETRPACNRCTTSGRTCDGYASSTTAPQSRRALADAVRHLQVAGPASRVLGDPVAADDAACFDFFRHCTSSMTGSVLPAPFWERQVLQMAYGERAVWRVVVALGALRMFRLLFFPRGRRGLVLIVARPPMGVQQQSDVGCDCSAPAGRDGCHCALHAASGEPLLWRHRAGARHS